MVMNQQNFHDLAVANQKELENIQIDLDTTITSRLTIENDIEQFVPKLKK